MKITGIKTIPVEIPVREEMQITSSRGSHRVSPFLIVILETDEGITGIGEATTMPKWSGETCWTAKSLIDNILSTRIQGHDPCDIGALNSTMDKEIAHNWFTKSAIEMACWDAWGKSVGKPVYELLGGPHRPRTIPARFSMAAYEPGLAAEKAVERVSWGFQTIKIKVGTHPDADVDRVRAVRSAVGPDISIVIDANCGWDADTAIQCCHKLEGVNLTLVEQPTPDGDYESLARVRRAINVPIMADDICFNLQHAKELIRNEACDVISVYPGKNGGILKTMEIVKYAEAHEIPCTIGSNLEWDIATSAMGHTVIGLANLKVEQIPGDILGPWYHVDRVVTHPLVIADATCTIPDSPGLGIDLDHEVIDRYKLSVPNP